MKGCATKMKTLKLKVAEQKDEKKECSDPFYLEYSGIFAVTAGAKVLRHRQL